MNALATKLLSLTYKVLTTSEPDYLYNLISVHSTCRTRSSSAVTLARPSVSSFRYASPYQLKQTRKPSYRWQTRATRKPAKNCSNSTCLQLCRWQYWPIFIRLAVVASKICEIPRNSRKIQTYGVQGHPRSSILVSIESPCTTSY